MNLILPDAMEAPTIPAWFLARLRDIDPGLVIYWNPFKQRFVIDRCTNDAPHTHDRACSRSNVMIVEDDAHGYMGPCERVLDGLKSIDDWTNFGTLANQRLTRENAKIEYDARVLAEAKERYKFAALDNKRQLQQAFDLIQRHDMRVNQ